MEILSRYYSMNNMDMDLGSLPFPTVGVKVIFDLTYQWSDTSDLHDTGQQLLRETCFQHGG